MAKPDEVEKVFTWEEVRRHKYSDDCWFVCHDKVYDVSEFVPNHPGGPRLWAQGGSDISLFFHVMHPPRVTVESHLAKYYIGVVEPIKASPLKFAVPALDVSDEYQELRKYVWKHLSEDFDGAEKFAKIFHSTKTWNIWFPVCTLLYLVGLAGILFVPKDVVAFGPRVLYTILVGILAAHMSFIVHDACHYRMRYSGVLWAWILGDFSGFWTHAFAYDHLDHHRTLGCASYEEPDIFDNMPFLRQRECERHWPWHRFQHLYFPLGWMTFLLKSFFMDLLNFPRGKYCRKRDFVTLALSKLPILALVVLSMVIGPFKDGAEDVLKVAVLILTVFASAGIVIGFVVGVVHHGASNTVHLKAVGARRSHHFQNKISDAVCEPETGSNDFMQGVIQNSLTIVPPLKVLNFFVLGLSYHVEHHLFPSVPYWLLPRVQVFVTQYCRERNIKVNNNLSFTDAYRLYLETLRQLGQPPKNITSNAANSIEGKMDAVVSCSEARASQESPDEIHPQDIHREDVEQGNTVAACCNFTAL